MWLVRLNESSKHTTMLAARLHKSGGGCEKHRTDEFSRNEPSEKTGPTQNLYVERDLFHHVSDWYRAVTHLLPAHSSFFFPPCGSECLLCEEVKKD